MYRFKFLAIAAMFVFGAGAFLSSQAQKRMTIDIVPPQPTVGALSGTYRTSVGATEINVGEQNEMSNETYGWTSNGVTTGDLSGHIFLSVNYTWPGFGDEIGTEPAVTNIICGGSWSQLIYVNGVYQGSVSGRILSGTITWDEKTRTSKIEMQLAADNGTDAYLGSVGTGSFSGSMDRRSQDVPAINGTLTLVY